jgi:hypothetical protein
MSVQMLSLTITSAHEHSRQQSDIAFADGRVSSVRKLLHEPKSSREGAYMTTKWHTRSKPSARNAPRESLLFSYPSRLISGESGSESEIAVSGERKRFHRACRAASLLSRRIQEADIESARERLPRREERYEPSKESSTSLDSSMES